MRLIFLTFISIFFSISVNAQSLTDSLKIHLKFDNNLRDSSGNNYHFQGNSSLNYVPFHLQDSAISFNGNNGASMASTFINQATLNEVAICLWFKTNHSSQQNQVLVQGAYMGSNIQINSSTGLLGGTFEVPTATNSIFDSISRLDNKWHHVVLQNNGNITFFYVDGQLINQKNQQMIGRSTNKFHLGNTNLNTKNFTGSINDFRVYTRTLTQIEINTLSELPSFYDTLNTIVCEPMISPSGKYKWNQSGTYYDTTENSSGFRTIHLINLIISPINDSVSFSNNTLQSHEPNAIYQWLDCNNNFAEINGETNSAYHPSQNGSYAVEITKGSCKDTSACENVLLVGQLERNQIKKSVKLFPNPTNNEFNVDLGDSYRNVEIQLLDINGKLMDEKVYSNKEEVFQHNFSLNPGVYLVKIIVGDSKTIFKKLFVK